MVEFEIIVQQAQVKEKVKLKMLQNIKQRIKIILMGKDHGAPGTEDKFTCGTLKYTPATLAVLFVWLLWGDFAFSMMEMMPQLLGMQLKDHPEISNSTIAFMTGSLAMICNVMLNPIYSSWSDRFRSRWGRRRPFLMFATPFVTLFLILIPWAPNFTDTLMKISWTREFLTMFPAAPIVLMFGILIVSFHLFNMFIVTIYYYLIPDTVPLAFIGRFQAMFRVVGITAGMLFNWFLFGHAHAHMRLMFAVFGIIYAISFTLMCWKVKEGEYPDVKEQHGHWYSPFRNYAKECFGSTRYWLIFLIYGSTQWAGAANMFALFFYRDQMGLTETAVGRMGAVSNGLALLLAVLFGAMVDRLGGLKSLMIGLIVGISMYILGFISIQGPITAVLIGPILYFPILFNSLAMSKFTIEMYPRAQYGQFGSAGAMVGAAGFILLAPMAGNLVDYFGNYYRLFLIVPPICYGLSLVGCLILHRSIGNRILSQETVSGI